MAMLVKRKGVQPHLPNGMVAGQYAQALRYATGSGPIRNHLQHLNQWTQLTMRVINWTTAHGQAHRKKIHLRILFSKLGHDILPTLDSNLDKFDKSLRVVPHVPLHLRAETI